MRPALLARARQVPVRTRVVAAFALGSTAVSALVAVATWNLTTGYMLQQRQDSAVRQASVDVRLVEAALRRDSNGIGDLLTGLAASPKAAIFVRRPDGWISGGTAADGIGPEDVPASLLAAAERGDIARQRLRVGGIPVVAVAMPLPGTGEEYVEVFPLRELDRTFRFVSLLLGAGVLASAPLGGSVGLWASRRALRPLTELTAAAGRVAHGDLSTRLPVHPDPDLGPIALAFNETAGDLQARVERDARFASDVSHELRSPVTTMAAAMEVLIRRRDEVSPPARHAIDLLDADLRRFRRLVEDLLEISKVDQGAFRLSAERLDLGQLAGQVVAPGTPGPARRAGGQLPGGRRTPATGTGRGEPGRQRRAARPRAAAGPGPAGGRAGPTGSGRRRAGGAGGRPGPDLRAVRPGLRPGPDRRRDRQRLGLALVAQHVRLHSGRIQVTDRPGGGARFVVELACGEDR